MLDFKCEDCGCTNYKLIYWHLKRNVVNRGVYCSKCDKWLKFLGKHEQMEAQPTLIVHKQQRKRKKDRNRKK